MNNHVEQYRDFEALVREARMQRSVAIANGIAAVVGALSVGVSRVIGAISSRGIHLPNLPSQHS